MHFPLLEIHERTGLNRRGDIDVSSIMATSSCPDHPDIVVSHRYSACTYPPYVPILPTSLPCLPKWTPATEYIPIQL